MSNYKGKRIWQILSISRAGCMPTCMCKGMCVCAYIWGRKVGIKESE